MKYAYDPLGSATYTYNARRLPSNVLNLASIQATYDNDDQLKTQTLAGVTKTVTWDPAGNATDLTYVRNVCSTNCTMAEDHVKYDAQDRWVSEATGTGNRSQTFAYDGPGRLKEVADKAAGGVCTTRVYEYSDTTPAGKDSNRTSLRTYPAGAGNACSTTTTPTTKAFTYDSADRLTNAYGNAVTYDIFSRVKSAGTLLSQATYFMDDQPMSLNQGGVTQNYTEDPTGRTHTRQAGPFGDVETQHYSDDSDTPSWTESKTASGNVTERTRYITGVDGDIVASQKFIGGGVTFMYMNLHGDLVAEVGAGATAPTWTGTYDEFGNAQTTNGRRYGWLGGAQRSTESSGGLIQMGQRTYLAPIGRFLQIDPVDGGSANDYDYINQDPINGYDLGGESGGKWICTLAGCFYVAIAGPTDLPDPSGKPGFPGDPGKGLRRRPIPRTGRRTLQSLLRTRVSRSPRRSRSLRRSQSRTRESQSLAGVRSPQAQVPIRTRAALAQENRCVSNSNVRFSDLRKVDQRIAPKIRHELRRRPMGQGSGAEVAFA